MMAAEAIVVIIDITFPSTDALPVWDVEKGELGLARMGFRKKDEVR